MQALEHYWDAGQQDRVSDVLETQGERKISMKRNSRSGIFSFSQTCVPGSVSGPLAVINTRLVQTFGHSVSLGRSRYSGDQPSRLTGIPDPLMLAILLLLPL
jgi:hypothetical protein